MASESGARSSRPRGPVQLGPSLAPFVGRERDLNALLERVAAAERGEGGVVLISGEPGVGKSRLLAEIASRAPSRGWRVLAGRAYDVEGMPPYLPFVDVLREYFSDLSGDNMAARVAAITVSSKASPPCWWTYRDLRQTAGFFWRWTTCTGPTDPRSRSSCISHGSFAGSRCSPWARTAPLTWRPIVPSLTLWPSSAGSDSMREYI
ncbi:MAG: ATP-binding protein [Chloroflexi bacterium]|nr:MAG: ATP-binding protein [Chloroflexota bacterium]